MPIEVTPERGEPFLFGEDESVRPDTTLEKLAKLKPIYGSATVTAGNAPGLNTGASAMVLMSPEEAERRGKQPLATLISWAMASGHPDRIASIPAESARLALEKVGLTVDELDLIEINEAFAAVPLRLDPGHGRRRSRAGRGDQGQDERQRRRDRGRASHRRDRGAARHDLDLRAPPPPGRRRRRPAVPRRRHDLRRRSARPRRSSSGWGIEPAPTSPRTDYAPDGASTRASIRTRAASARSRGPGSWASTAASARRRRRTRASGPCSRLGTTGFSVALDLPTQMGLDSDDPLAEGEVGRVGVALDSLADVETLMEGIPLESITQVRTTANSIGYIWAALVRRAGGEAGRRAGAIRDLHPERRPQGVHRARHADLRAGAVAEAEHGRGRVHGAHHPALGAACDLRLPHP